MISNKSKAAIALGIIMLSNLTITNAESKIISSNETILSNNLSNNSEYSSNANLSYLNNEASSNDASTTFNINSDSDLAFNNDYYSNIVTKNNSSNEVINSDSTLEDNSSNASIKNNVFEDNSSNDSIYNDITIEDDNSNEVVNNDTDLDNNSSSEIIDNEIVNDGISSNEAIDMEDNSSNIIIDNNISIEDNIDNGINIAQNTITCPEINQSPVLTASDGFNKNGIGDSVYDHLKGLGWTAIDSNTINVNDGRLQFKNMNGLNNIDSIITIRCDFEENDKYVLYLLKLMIGDKSISTATPSDSEIFSGAFDDTYYDNFENLVRRIANGSGIINYSNRSIRVQYDGKLDYTITLTFSNYNNNTTGSTPSVEEDNGNIIYSEIPEI